MVRLLGFHCQGLGSVPGQGTEILQAMWNGQKKKKSWMKHPQAHTAKEITHLTKNPVKGLNPSGLAHRRPAVCTELDEAFFSVTHEGCSSLSNFPYPSALSAFISLSFKLPGLSELHD